MTWTLVDEIPPPFHTGVDYVLPFTFIVSAGFLAFGVAWFVSSFRTNPAFAAWAGVMVPWMILQAILLVESSSPLEKTARDQLLEIGFPIASLALGTIGLLAGTWNYFRHVEPE